MTLSTADVDRLIALPKLISEVIKWNARVGFAGARHSTMVRVVVPDAEDELELRGEAGISPSGQATWAWAIRHLDERRPIRRVDVHPRRHRNPDGTIIRGCMLHGWDEHHKDRWATQADGIDCTSVNTALADFLKVCNIKLLTVYQPLLLPREGGSHASMQ